MDKKIILDKREAFKNLVFLIIFIFLGVFLFWKAKFGFGNIDESFYMTIPYRLAKGDALFLEEWHLSQMSGVLTYPFVWLYLKIVGSTEGIILTFRYLYTLLQLLISLFLYIRLKKISWIAASVASISYALYIPFAIMAFSYNSMGIMALTLAVVIVFTAKKHKKIQFVFSGIAFSASVLCCPYLAGVYVLYIIAVFIKKDENNDDFWSKTGALFFAVGIIASVLVFSVFVLSRAPLSEIIKVFPYILDDPEHKGIPFLKSFVNFFVFIWNANKITPFIYSLLIPLAFFACFFKKYKRVIFFIAEALTLILIWGHYALNNFINHLMWSVNVLAVFAFILTDNKLIKRIFYTVWIPGILYAFCINITSNQGFYAISSGSSVASLGSIVMIILYSAELLEKKRFKFSNIALISGVTAIMLSQILTQGYMRYESVFWEKDLKSQQYYLDSGPEKGIYAAWGRYRDYKNKLPEIKALEENGIKNVLFLSENTWYYLAGDFEISAYSAWLSGVHEDTFERLKVYYKINPEKVPEAVYTDAKYIEKAKDFCESLGFLVYPTKSGAIFK